ncbi:hypothetical protein [Enterocloster clostridioformis]|uniref:hypothetical protein n=1 Tax=Enterocloster clostridioformis TaxID=1531 RepID=UPI0003A73483|nr:hypothetical protein [Enterocloster clostridioformis]
MASTDSSLHHGFNWQKCWTKYIEQQIKALREELHRLHQEQLYAREVKGHGVWQEHL